MQNRFIIYTKIYKIVNINQDVSDEQFMALFKKILEDRSSPNDPVKKLGAI